MSPRRHAVPAPPPPVTSAQLRAFHAVADRRSFTAAAEALGVSQPAVSMQVRALEEAHGVELLARSHRSVAPTALGASLLDITRRMFAVEAEAAELLDAASALLHGHLRIGADAPFLVVPLLADFHAQHPKVELALVLGNSNDVLRDLLDGRTDVAALSDRVDDPRLFAIPAARSRQVVIVSRAHPWARRTGVRLADLDGAPMLVREEGSITRRAFESAIARTGVRPAVVMEIGSREALQEAVAAGLGAAVIIEAERGRDDRIVALPITDVVIEHVEYVACLQDRRRLRAIAAFLDRVPRLPSPPRARNKASRSSRSNRR
ncbi:Transcriptional regulator, LysR family protein [Minicystis rosea]|nr:Transcriptional regulator, LysR family protein [Minicystis rosea]